MKETKKKPISIGKDGKPETMGRWAFWKVIKTFFTNVSDAFQHILQIVSYVVEATLSTIATYWVLIFLSLVPLFILYLMSIYGELVTSTIAVFLDTIIKLFNLIIKFYNSVASSAPILADIWNSIMDMLFSTLGELARILEAGIPDTKIDKGIKRDTFRAPSQFLTSQNYLTSATMKGVSKTIVGAATVIVNVLIVWVKVSIYVIDVVSKFFKALVCGNDQCESVCGKRGCFNFLVAVYWIFSLIYYVAITLGVLIGNIFQTILDLFMIPAKLDAEIRHIFMYILYVVTDFGSVLKALKAWCINTFFAPFDLLQCSIFTKDQFGPCLFRPVCRMFLSNVLLKILFFYLELDLTAWVCDVFGTGPCDCGRCTWFLGVQVPCMLHPDCDKCYKPFTFFHVFFPAMTEYCLTCPYSDVMNAAKRADRCPAYCYADGSATFKQIQALQSVCPPDDELKPLYCKIIKG